MKWDKNLMNFNKHYQFPDAVKFRQNKLSNVVKLVYKDQQRKLENMALMNRWSLYTG